MLFKKDFSLFLEPMTQSKCIRFGFKYIHIFYISVFVFQINQFF